MTTSRKERLAALLASAEKMAGGEVSHRADISPERDELDALAHALNVVVGEVCYSADLLARTREQAAVTERFAALGELAGEVAHQIRNPLAVILNATSVLNRALADSSDPDVLKSIAIIQEEVRRTNAIVTALLDYARQRVPERRPTCIADLLDGVFAKGSVPSGVRVKRTVAHDIPLVDVDRDQLRAALASLVAETVEAMPDGGSLDVDVASADGVVVIAVVCEDAKPFEGKQPMGLGLLTARTVVEAHGGKLVAVSSATGQRFEIRLPATPDV